MLGSREKSRVASSGPHSYSQSSRSLGRKGFQHSVLFTRFFIKSTELNTVPRKDVCNYAEDDLERETIMAINQHKEVRIDAHARLSLLHPNTAPAPISKRLPISFQRCRTRVEPSSGREGGSVREMCLVVVEEVWTHA